MKMLLCGMLTTAALLTSLNLPASADSRAVRESRAPSNYVPATPSAKSGVGGYFGTGGYTGGYTGYTAPIPDSMPAPPQNQWESASPYNWSPCDGCDARWQSPYEYDNPAADLPTYEEMNPNTDRYPLRPQWMEGE
jgi:hypothetical protein